MAKDQKPTILKKTHIDYVNFKSKKISTEDVVFRKIAEEERIARREARKKKKSAAEEFKATLIDGRWVQIDDIVRECRETGIVAYLDSKTSNWILVEDIEDLPLSRYKALMEYRNRRPNSEFNVLESANIKGDLTKIK